MSTTSSGHDELREQAALYVLEALTGPARDEFEAHMAGCAECKAEVQSLSRAADALAHVVPQHEPPAALRSRVMTSVGVTPSMIVASPAGRERTSAVIAWFAAAASVALAIALGAYAASLRTRIDALEVRLREALQRADAGERQIADARRAALEAQSQVAVLTAPDLQRIDLAGQAVAAQASARAFWSRSRGLVFTASGLPPVPAGRTYQLWVLSARPAPISAGVFKPDPDGRVDARFDTPQDLPQPTAMAVTLEPEGGVPAPTGAMYLVSP